MCASLHLPRCSDTVGNLRPPRSHRGPSRSNINSIRPTRGAKSHRCETFLLQEEFASFKETAEQVAEAKDTELERLLGVNAGLRDEITVLNNRQVLLLCNETRSFSCV